MNGGAGEVFELAADLGKASTKVASQVYDVFEETGLLFATAWRANATATSGQTGRKYPPTIDHEMVFAGLGVAVEVGPNPANGNPALAGRGYELGSRNQPPHLDGLRAMGPAVAILDRRATTALNGLMP